MIRAVEKVPNDCDEQSRLLKRCVLYAVVGGNAVAAWVRVDEAAVRNTQDVDILCSSGCWL